MFDLEEKISEWRRQMLAAGIKTPVPLEELEIHLREEIEQQMELGLNEQQAFNSAVQKIGQGETLNSEFGKNNQKERSLIIIAGIFAMGFVYVFNGVVWWQAHKTVSGWNILQILGGLGMAILAGYDLIHTIKNRSNIGTEK